MSKVAAISVQSVSRPATARRVTPASQVETPKAKAAPAAAAPAVTSLAPQLQAFADLGAMIQLQASHADPQPTHGNDQHGHGPAEPPVIQPPVAQPPVSVDPKPGHGNDDQHGHETPAPPPVSEPPPVVQPPAASPPPVAPPPAPRPVIADPAVARRALVILNQTLSERDAIRAEGAAFTAFAADRQATASITENHTAVALLQVLQAGMTTFDQGFSASRLRGGLRV